MKKLILILLLSVSRLYGGVVNNSGSTGADSITFNFYLLDSAGNITTLAVTDSIGLVVFYPEGAVAYSTTVLGNNSGIHTQTLSNIGSFYSYSDAVANIDGTSATDGLYTWNLTINDISLGLKTPHSGEFQLYTTDDFNNRFDNIDVSVSSRSSFDSSNDSVLAKANILAVSDDANSADSLEALVDGESDFQLELKQLYIDNPNGSAIYARSQASNGHGMYLESTQGGNGLYAVSTGTGDGIKAEAGNGNDISAGELQSIQDTVNNILVSIPDSSTIARSIWNTPHANHNISGTFGDYLDAEISGLGSGSGLYSFTLIAYDSLTDQTLSGVNIVIRNLDQTSLVALGNSDANGTLTVNLDAGSYLSIANATGYIFNGFDTISITGTGEDTLFGYQFNPGEPSSPDLCRVYGYLYDINGQPEQDLTVTASLPSGVVRSGSRIISPFKITSITDTLGYFCLDLIPSDSLIPAGQLYEITITEKDGTILRQRMTIPSQSNWQLTW